MARIGIFGGSFNPPHLGHVLAIQEFQKKLELDCVLLIPAAVPPHKQLDSAAATAAQRLEMTRLAVAALPWAQVLDLELQREGKSYTADTVELLRQRYPTDSLFLLMGTDMFLSFSTWYQVERIVRAVTLAVAHRDTDQPQRLRQCAAELEQRCGARSILVENRFLPHSSTAVRAMLTFGCAEPYLAPAVLAYIRALGLYGVGQSLRVLPFAALCEASLRLHKSSRVNHALGCSETAQALALRWGADPVAARRAGILHDVTKALNAQEQLHLCEKYDIVLNHFERQNPKLLHAKTGAAVARAVFGETEAVAQAICWHTTGRANMSLLEKILYLADYIEPNRELPGVQELRHLAQTDLDAALLRGLEMSVAHVNGGGNEVDPNSLAALRFLQERNDPA